MGKIADQQETTDRSRSWARSLTWAKPSLHKKRTSEPQLPVVEPSRAGKNGSLDPTARIPTSSSSGGDVIDVKPTVAEDAAKARSGIASSSQDTQAAGEKSTALDGTADSPTPKIPMTKRAKAGSLRFLSHTKNALLHSWINVLLIFVPIGIASNFAHMNPALVFAFNAIAVIPLAGLLAHATESVASRLGDTLGALLNVSFGNAVELIIFMYVLPLGGRKQNALLKSASSRPKLFLVPYPIALVKNEIRIVQASLLGSILANLLLILGMAFAAGGLRYQEQIYNNTVTQMSAVLLSLSVMSLLLPTAFHASFSDTANADRTTLKVSRGTSVILLIVYVLYLLFQLKSHAYLYASMPQEQIDEESRPGMLADIMNDSTSSSSSSSSSDSDTDTTSGSHTTAKKKFKRFIRKRRKSSASSAESPSTASHINSPTIEPVSPGYFDDVRQASRRPSVTLPDILSGDEGDHEGARGQVREQDFGSGIASGSQSPDKKQKKKSKRHHLRHKKVKKSKGADFTGAMAEKEAEAEEAKDVMPESELQSPRVVGFTDDVIARDQIPPRRKNATFYRPALPKLLSQNVFVDPQPAPANLALHKSKSPGTPGLRRTNSLPDRLDETDKASARPGNRPLPNGRMPTGRPLAPNAARGAWVARAKPEVDPAHATDDEEDVTVPEMSRTAAVMLLLISTGLVAFCAEFLVDAIPQMTANSNVSQAFIGLIILPIVGNAAEHVTAVTVAAKNKMDLAIGVAVGSSIQIALFVTPVVVLLGWCLDKEMTLYFNIFEVVSLFATVFVVNFLVLDGRSNYLEGTLLMAAYIIIAVAAFFYPDGDAQSALGGSDTSSAARMMM